MRQIILSVLALLILSGCFSTKIVYVNKFIRPELPQLVELERPSLEKIKFDKVVQNGLQLYCIDAQIVQNVRKNQWVLQNKIKSYEEMIKVYNEFYADYEQKRIADED